jgi:hypothetical protein
MHTGNPHHKLKQKIEHELKRFWLYTLFLTVLFSMFNIYNRILLNDYTNKHMVWGYALIEALILAKIILIGDAMKLGKKYAERPIIIPIIHKTILFTILVLIFSILEHLITGLIYGRTIEATCHEIITRNLHIAIAKSVVMCFVFFFFFALLETSRALGNNILFNLCFKPRYKL